MKNRSGGLFISLLIAVHMSFLAGCAPAAHLDTPARKRAPDRKIIGLSLYYSQDEFYRDTEAAFVEEAENRGYEIIISDANADLYNQVQHLEDFIARKVDLILMSAVDAGDIVGTVEEINKAGIPIIAYDEPPLGGELLACVIWDNYEQGRMIGKWAGKYIEKSLEGKAEIAILDLPNQYYCMERVRGFLEVIGEMPGVKIVAQEDCKADRAYSMTVVENILNLNKDLNMVVGVMDEAAFGAVAAVETADRDVAVLCAGSWSVEAMKALNDDDKYYKANVTVSPYEQAKAAFDIIDAYFAGKPFCREYHMTQKVYDAGNIGEIDWKAIEARRSK